MIARVLKPIRIDDGKETRIVHIGTTIDIDDQRVIDALVTKGYIRLVSPEATKQVLDGYVEYAREVLEYPMLEPCVACKEKKYWLSIYGAVVCGVCHPPASDKLIKRWL